MKTSVIRAQVKAMKTASMVILTAAVLIVIAALMAGCGKTHVTTHHPSYQVSSNANIPGYESPSP